MWVEYRCITWSIKNRPHIYIFWRKIFMDSRQFFALWFWDFLHVLYAYYAERKFCHKYTHALSPVWNRPPYTRIICEKNFAPDIYENCGAFEICVWLIELWYLRVRLYHILYMWSSFEEGCFYWLVDVKFWLEKRDGIV